MPLVIDVILNLDRYIEERLAVVAVVGLPASPGLVVAVQLALPLHFVAPKLHFAVTKIEPLLAN